METLFTSLSHAVEGVPAMALGAAVVWASWGSASEA
jgi:hypothetical protein